MKTLPRLLSTTIVFPNEYDLDAQIRESIKESNTALNPYMPMDIGKVVGLYIAYKKLQEASNE